jgi:Zn finger protein HypA/HybF involved in hydrogenase expression
MLGRAGSIPTPNTPELRDTVPYAYLYQCPECRFDVEIIGAKEFTLDAAGERQDYQYPEPGTYEWPVKRVAGLWNRLWCPVCRVTRHHVLVELDEPAEHPVQAFLHAEHEGLTGSEVGPCPECGTPLTFDPEGLPCPHCGSGTLELIGEYEP